LRVKESPCYVKETQGELAALFLVEIVESWTELASE
jgi:hypothetical protein